MILIMLLTDNVGSDVIIIVGGVTGELNVTVRVSAEGF